MDIALARTFLTIAESGSFIETARRMNLTQSTVSARVRSLENMLGQPLFVRSKLGARLTSAGEQFQAHALALVRVWQQAQLDVGRSGLHSEHLSIGAETTLWQGLLVRWIGAIRAANPTRAVTATAARGATLVQRLRDGTLDLAVLYRPIPTPGLVIEHLFEEELVLVSSAPSDQRRRTDDYVLVDWGPDFRDDHAIAFPRLAGAPLTLDLGSLALDFLLDSPGSGYLPLRLVARHLSRGRLRLISRARRFFVPVGAVYPEARAEESFAPVIESLRARVARLQ